jgi:hypothetical protein
VVAGYLLIVVGFSLLVNCLLRREIGGAVPQGGWLEPACVPNFVPDVLFLKIFFRPENPVLM